MIAAMMRAMQAAGCLPEQIIAAIAAWYEDVDAREEDRKAKARDANKRRQQAWRERNAHNAHNALLPSPPFPPLKETPHTPLENNPPISPSPSLVGESADVISIDRKKSKETDRLRAFGAAWNVFASGLRLPMIDEIKPGSPREKAALARLRENCDFDVIFAKIRGSPFLRGERASFRGATFDFITNPTNMAKILEGNYDESRQAQR